MIEKIKDILYDLSDIAVSLLIIAVIFVSVSWKISDTLNVNLADTLTKPSVETESELPVTVIIPDINTETPTESTDNESSTETDTQTPDAQPNNDSSVTDNSAPANNTDTTSTNTETTNNTETATNTAANNNTSVTLVAFEVSEGSTGYSIGKKLVSEGYIDDVDAFVNRLVALKLDNKLRAGTFKLSKSDSLDTIIKVLAGQGR